MSLDDEMRWWFHYQQQAVKCLSDYLHLPKISPRVQSMLRGIDTLSFGMLSYCLMGARHLQIYRHNIEMLRRETDPGYIRIREINEKLAKMTEEKLLFYMGRDNPRR